MSRRRLGRALLRLGLGLGLGLALALAAGRAHAGADAEIPDDQTLEERGAVIGEVIVRAGDIFDTSDPEENRALFRVANRLHRVTREGVIRTQLLFETGDPYSRRVLEESERILRSTRYLYDAEIRPVRYVGNRVDVEVRTRDVWTLTGGVTLSRSGGENATQFSLGDTNFFGTGRDIEVNRSSDVDRTSQTLKYRDLAVGGSRTSLEFWLAENSDGNFYRLELERPFFSLDSRWAAGAFLVRDERIDSRYSLGEITDRFENRQRYYELYAGRSSGLGEDGLVQRWTGGLTYDHSRFGADPDLPDAIDFNNPRNTFPPPDRTLAYPWIGYEFLQDGFVEASDLDQISRTEDLFLGRSLRSRLGWSTRALGADADEAVYELSARIGLGVGRGKMVLLGGGLAGRWSGDEGDSNVVAGVSARYYQRNFGRHLLFVESRFDATRRLDGDQQLLLGGDNGLRGYPLRYQEGDRRALLTLEQRFYTDWHLFRLVRVGGAVFADVGRAWFADPVTGKRELGTLKDVGIGLRLASSRSGQGAMVHLDLAFPLDGDDSIDSIQWLVTTKETF